jgi:hypothetical protein
LRLAKFFQKRGLTGLAEIFSLGKRSTTGNAVMACHGWIRGVYSIYELRESIGKVCQKKEKIVQTMWGL